MASAVRGATAIRATAVAAATPAAATRTRTRIDGQGALRIKVKPREAKVLVDGTFAGTVDDFDGNFQKLRLDEGAHKVELQADGFEPLRFDVLIVVGQTVTYKGKLRER